MDASGPVPAHGGRKPGQPDVTIDLGLLSPPRGGDSGVDQGLGLLGDGGVALATTPGHLPGRRVPEPPPDAGEAAREHPQPVGSAPALAHHQHCGNAPGLQPLTGDPGPEHPWSADVGPDLAPHQSVGDGQGPGHQ